jgi:integrase
MVGGVAATSYWAGTAPPRATRNTAGVLSEWEANGRRLACGAGDDLTIKELIAAFWRRVEEYYRRADGSPTHEVRDYAMSLRPLKHLYGSKPATEFGPLALKAVRQLLIKGYDHPKYGKQPSLSRGVVNQRIARIKRMVAWAVENELVPASVYHGLQAVRGLKRGRSEARETDAVKPVPVGFVNAVLPFMRPQVAAMVELQLATGMRPGEVVIMRGIDLDTSGAVWLYTPPAHKTAYRGHSRVIAIGPKGQSVLRPWLRLNVEQHLFSPRDAVEDLHSKRRQARRSKITPSQAARKPKATARRKPGDRYSVTSYGRAIARSIELANGARACGPCKRKDPTQRCEACRASAIPHWHPHQLRHTKATEIRRAAGLDAARAVLGHTSPVVTEVYAELDIATAAEVMAKIG